ncbi:MAG: Hsp70 family protein [Myxococcus sp.]|nr:Hsp70 family protein [Myxococcus sp.]
MAEKGRVVGIDLGTTNTLVASVKNRVPRIVPTDKGALVLPSVVSLSPRGDLVVGGVARDQIVTNPRNTIYGAKRLIGRKYDTKVVQALKSYFSYEIVPGADGDAAVSLGGRVYSLPEVSAMVLGQAKTIAEQFLQAPITEAVITVPAYYTDNQRQAVKQAGQLAGFVVKRIVNEPTAAALAYGFNRGLDQRILVYDLGGGTFDVSVLDVKNNVFEVVATGGDTFLGGLDFDNRIIDFVVQAFLDQTKVDLTKSPIAMQRVKNAAEAAKIDLSLMQNVTIELPYVEERKGKPLDLRIPLAREQLNSLTRDLVDRTFEICDDVLTEKGITRSSIDEVILVGGQSRMPLVQQRIQEHFGKPARKGVHPDECVALGAALLGESMDSPDSVLLLDAVSMPIGYGLPTGRFRKIIEKNHRVPMVKSFRVPPPQKPGAPFIEIDIFQGDSEFIVDNEYLGTVKLPAASTGRRIDFRVDHECLLHVFLEGAGEPAEVKLATRDTPELLKKAVAEAMAKRSQQDERAAAEKGGLFSSIKRLLGGD